MTTRHSPCRVAYISQFFEPEPVLKGLAFAKQLAVRDFDVEVITGFPNYPTGNLYSGYRIRCIQREVIGGVKVVRLPLFPSHDQSAFRRVLNYLSFSLSVAIYGLFFMRRADVMYVYHPPLTVGLAATLIRFFRRIPFVYDIQDLWPDTLSATGMVSHKRVLSLVGVACRLVYRMASHITVLSPGFKVALVKRGVPSRKVSVIMNWADERALDGQQPTVTHETALSAGFNVLFAGNMGKAQGLEALLDAAEVLSDNGSSSNILFIGQGVERSRLEALAKAKSIRNVRFLDPVGMTEIGSYLREADALIVHLKADHLFEITIPSKTQAYMCVGRPVIMAVRGDAADLIRISGGGVVADPGDPYSIAHAVLRLERLSPMERDKIGKKGRSFYSDNLSLQIGADRFAEVLRTAANGSAV